MEARLARTRSKLAILNLERSVQFLNGGGDTDHPHHASSRTHLIELITEWQKARSAPPNAFEREHGVPLPPLLKMRLPKGSPTWKETEESLTAHLTPQNPGVGVLVTYRPKRSWTAWDHAWNFFIQLLQNADIERFAGPCRRCGRYYIRKTAKPSVYCSRECASQATAIKRTIENRKRQHAQKLELAVSGIERWRSLVAKGRTKKGWKEFVANDFKSADPALDLTVRFLSRAVNKGELIPPETK
jgi:hypothetical protein